MCLFLCVSACVGPQVSTAARAEAEVHAWACHLSDLAHRRYENARKICQQMNDPAAWMKALMRRYGVMQRGQPLVAAGSRKQRRSSAHVVADSLAVKSSQVNTLRKAKSKTRSKQKKDMHKCSSVYSERGVPLSVLTSGGE